MDKWYTVAILLIIAAIAGVVYYFRAKILALLGLGQSGTGTGGGTGSTPPPGGISIKVSGHTWNISGLTPSGVFTVSETAQGFSDYFQYTADSNGNSTKTFSTGTATSGSTATLLVTDKTTGATASTTFTV